MQRVGFSWDFQLRPMDLRGQLALAALRFLLQYAKSLRKPAGEAIAIQVGESRMRVHQPVHRRRHFAFEQFLGCITRLLSRSLPFREVQHRSAFDDIVLNEP